MALSFRHTLYSLFLLSFDYWKNTIQPQIVKFEIAQFNHELFDPGLVLNFAEGQRKKGALTSPQAESACVQSSYAVFGYPSVVSRRSTPLFRDSDTSWDQQRLHRHGRIGGCHNLDND